MKKAFQNLPYNLLLIIILVIGAIYLFAGTMDLYPAYVHSWTQSDRLAIAMRFQESGFDFFHPSTYNLLTKDGITQVDFPIHDYLVAVISSFFNLDIISTFRFYNLFYSLIGLFFLYRSSFLLSKSALKSSLITIFIATLPFFAYYQNGFLPSNPSFANFCIGIFFLISHHQHQKSSTYYWSIFFFSLAALSRIPFTIFLIAVLLQKVYIAIQTKKVVWRELIPPLLGLGLVLLYFLYNQSLAEQYGSMFLSEFRRPESLGDLMYIIQAAAERWAGQIFSPYHWIILLLFIWAILFKREKKKSIDSFLVLALFSSLGVIAYFLLMGLQFVDHDYYYIDTLLPILSIFLIIGVSKIEISRNGYTTAAAFSIITVIGAYSHASSVIDSRYSVELNGRSLYSYQVFERAKDDLIQWGIKNDDTLAFLDIGSTNIPFTIFKNKGYTSLSSGAKSCELILAEDFDYAILLDSFKISDSYFDYPEIAKQLKYVNGNGELSYYKKSTSSDVSQFFSDLVYHYQNDFENQFADSITNYNHQFTVFSDSSGNVLKIDSSQEYILTTTILISAEELDNDLWVAANLDIQSQDSAKGLQYILSIPPFYFAYYFESEWIENNGWQNNSFIHKIPSAYLKEGAELKIYFWNKENSEAYIDNYHITLYQ